MDIPIHMKELLFVKISNCSEDDKSEVFRIAKVFEVKITDYDKSIVLLECVQTETKNNDLIKLLQKYFCNRIEVVRGGSVAIEAISMSNR